MLSQVTGFSPLHSSQSITPSGRKLLSTAPKTQVIDAPCGDDEREVVGTVGGVEAAGDPSREQFRHQSDRDSCVCGRHGPLAGKMVTSLRLGGGIVMDNHVILESVLTCPHCGFAKLETMPRDDCQFFYECLNCMMLLPPTLGIAVCFARSVQ